MISVKGINVFDIRQKKAVIFIFVIALFRLGATSAFASVPSDAVKWNGHAYKIFHTGMTWNEAKEKCKNADGHLVTITSASEQKIVASLVVGGVKNYYWLGACRDSQGNFNKWISGEPISYQCYDLENGEPNNFQGNENVLVMYRIANPRGGKSGALKWNDLNDSGYCNGEDFFGKENSGYICEWDYTQDDSIKSAIVTLAKTSFVYEGSAIKPTVIVSLNGKTLTKNKDYKISYANNNTVGTASVTITGKGKYKDSVTVKFKIKLNGVVQSNPVRNENGLKLSWSSVKGATGYEIYYKIGTGHYQLYKTVTAKSYTMTSAEIQCDADYTFKVRAYKKNSNTTLYGSYSSEKKYAETPFVKIGKKYYYQGKTLTKNKYELELPLIVSKELSVPEKCIISAKDLTAEADISLGKMSELDLSGNATIKKHLSLSQNAKMTVSKDLKISSKGYLSMKANATITTGGSCFVNSSKNSTPREGSITVSGNVSLKKGFQSTYNNEIILSGTSEHTVEIVDKCTIGILNLSQTNTKKLIMKGNGKIYGTKLQFDYKKGTYDLANEFIFSDISLEGTSDKDINRTIANSLFVIMALKACDGKDLLSDFYGSMAGGVVYTKKEFTIPIAVTKGNSKKAEYGTLTGDMQGPGELKFGTVSYKPNKGWETYTVVVTPSVGKSQKEIDRFMNKLKSGARKEISSMIIHDILLSQLASSLSEAADVFEWSKGKIIATSIDGGLLFKDFKETLGRYNSIIDQINKKW